MENIQYNQQRYNRKKQWYRIRFGIQQLFNYPLLNLIWILYGIGVLLLVLFEQKLVSGFDVIPILEPVFRGCMHLSVILLAVFSALAIVQLIGTIRARDDEADICTVFFDRRGIENQSPILISKKTINRKITVREFYTSIPMKLWRERQEDICDRMSIRLVGDIEYGGKHHNIGNRIIIKSVEGRKPKERRVLYDDDL